jgi:hypothetical protein
MKFTKRSAQWRRSLERKKKAIRFLGGQVKATHGTHELPMRHAMVATERATPAEPTTEKTTAPVRTLAAERRSAFHRRWREKEARP